MSVIGAALVGALLLAIPGSPAYKKPTLGLDLQGGIEVILRAVPDSGTKLTTDGMQTAQQIMTNRVNAIGLSSPNVAVQGGNEIVIQLAGVHDPAKAAAIIGKTGQLQFFDFEKDLAPPTVNNGQPRPVSSLYSLLKQVQGEAKKGKPSGYYLFRVKKLTKKVTTKVKGKKVTKNQTTTHTKKLQGPDPDRRQLLLPYGGKQPADTQILEVPANRLPVSSAGGKLWYLFKYFTGSDHPNGPPELTGKDLNESGITADVGDQGPEVVLSFKSHGAKEFQRITKAEYDRGKLAAGLAQQAGNHDPNVVQQYAGHNAIVLDGVLKSTPYIDYTENDLALGIAGGQARITIGQGGGGLSAAKDLALVLKSGSLPYTFQQIERTDVTATLGKSSLHQAIWAAVAGLAIVAVFLLFLYRFLGLVAVAGLAIYALLYYAAIQLFGVTLTLPGFAGLILTIGVAADANVVVSNASRKR
jgi:SecD/SecF fusion protein